ncbi:HYR domain-containing protein [Flavobacterium sp. LHD-80]|uniref:HYR domain-containing protein n=1 Tax=Flavobacterium sp. LHD-80 TaxID=3071411 RepID=UPI0027DF301A|nr:HYR domain-containing protein [Flavobacterium sp. LHD-80]MDQ6471613.1 HYR domain-containing protein [Flavobacterium sp. LHD-80]
MKNNKTVFKKTTQFVYIIFFLGIITSYSQNGCPQIPQSALNGFNGFSSEGKAGADDFGKSVKSAGDINNDGIDDLMIGAPNADFGGVANVGEIYIIFGKSGLSISNFDVTTLNGTNGFVIRGVAANEKLGGVISDAGDLNNDGIDDIVIGSDLGTQATAYVVYGSSSPFLALYNRTDLNTSNSAAFLVDSALYTDVVDVSKAGDLNHDGISDVLLTIDGGFYAHYVVIFGKAGLTNLNTSTLNGSNGFIIGGYHITFLGTSAIGRNAGDINNDGIDDLLFGIPSFSDGGFTSNGRAVVWFGKNTAYASLYSLDTMGPTEGFAVTGTGDYNYLGASAAGVRDFNNDGIDDVLISGQGRTVNGATQAGEAFVLFGRNTPFPALFSNSTLNATNSVIFQGKNTYENFGYKVNSVRDVNNDGKNDIIISAKKGGRANNGAAYVVFRGTTAAGIIGANQITGTKGYQVFNDESYYSFYNFGTDVTGLGDFNADGTNDFAVGSIGSNSIYNIKGKAYVFYGEKSDRTDAVKPIINCPSGIELYANSTLPNYVHSLVTISDNCTDVNDLLFTQNPPEGTLFTADTNVTITIKDESGNTNSCSFLVKLKTNTPVLDCRTPYLRTTDLNGTIGFAVYGEKAAGGAGASVNTAGDVNGDGITDFIIGAPGTYDSTSGKYENIYRTINGAGYVVYGTSAGFPPNVDLALLNGTNGFIIRNDLPQTNFPVTGYDVSAAGDINGDGIGDFMISDPYRHTTYGNEVGHVYVVFGKSGGFPAEFFLSSLNGTNGFALIGTTGYSAVGINVAKLGDINGDGIDDLGTVDNGNGWLAGNVFVIYGSHSAFPAVVRTNQINGTNGFIIKGDATAGTTGRQIAGLGDVNGDGIPDIGVGSGDDSSLIRKFVVFGRSSNFPASLSTLDLNGTNGFAIENSADPLYESIGIDTAGDVNGDGLNDIAITGSYILFGKNSFSALVDLKNLNGTNGTKFLNNGFSEVFGGDGDFNKDGFDDFLYRFGNGFAIYYGKSTWTATVDINTLTEKDCMRMYSFYPDALNFAGDINHDGIDDVIAGRGVHYYDIAPNYSPGNAYVIFGKKIEDTEKPVITNCPSNQNLNIGDAIPDYKTVITVTDNCDTNPLIEQTPLPGTIYAGGTQIITLKATDAKTNFQTCSFTVSVGTDTQAPQITCPADQQLACGSLVPNYLSQLIVSDDTDLSIDVTQFPGAGSTFFDGMQIDFTAKDDAGNESNCSIILHASGADTEPPTFTCPTNVTLNCGDVIPNYAIDPIMNLADNCSDIVHYEMTPADGTPFYDGIPIHIKYTDESGNESFCDFIVHNATPDITKPVISCTGNKILACGSLLPDYRSFVTATDNCAGTVTFIQNPAVGTPFTAGMTVTIRATDVSGNYADCSFIINASADIVKPVITCIGNQTLSCNSTIPDYRNLISVTDNCDASPVITQNPPSGTAFVDGMTIKITATDISGNYEDCNFIINASADVTKPIITCIANQTLSCNSTIPDYRNLISVTDNCDVSPVITQNPTAGTPFVDGMTVTITATDISGNYADCSFIINASTDVTKPVITCIGNQTLSCNSTIPDYRNLISVTDNCDASPVITQNPTAGTPFVDGMTIKITATDISGNYADCSFIINASADVVKPVITCIGNQTLSCNATIPDYRNLSSVTDNCDVSPVITQNPPSGTAFVDGMTVTITATDISGNYEDCSFIINASADVVKPVITCIGNQTLFCNSTIPDYRNLISVTDNCDASPVITQNPTAGIPFVDGMTVTITATDISGNYADCSFIINASADLTKPVIACIGDQLLSCGSVIPDYTPLVTANDNCDTKPVLTQSPAAGSVFTSGMTVKITATDISGNYSDCSFVVNASADVTAPIITCIGNQNLNFGALLPDYRSMITVTDNCDSNLTVTQTPFPGSPATNGMTVTMSTKDNSGNTKECSFSINVTSDNQAPDFTCLADQLVACNTKTIPDFTKMITVKDNYDLTPEVTQLPVAGSLFTEGMTVEIKAVDKSNNLKKCSFKVQSNPVVVDAGEEQQITEGEMVQLDAIALETGTYSWSPAKGLSNSKIANPSFFATETTTYTVTFKNAQGCEATDEVTIEVKPLEKDETKYGFSPNNDGINDFWEIDDITQYPQNQVLIYSRWGDLVFQIENYNNTTNVFSGIANRSRKLGANELPEGTYFFEIRVNQPHHFKKLKGYLVLKR